MDGSGDAARTEADWAGFRDALLKSRGRPPTRARAAADDTRMRVIYVESGAKDAAAAKELDDVTPDPSAASPLGSGFGAGSDSPGLDKANVWAHITASELNDMISGSRGATPDNFSTERISAILKSRSRRLRFLHAVLGDDFATAHYEEALSKRRSRGAGAAREPGRIGELTLASKLALLHGLQQDVGMENRSARAGVVALFLSARGEELTRLKAGVHETYHLVYRGLPRNAREAVLAHFASERGPERPVGELHTIVVCDAQDTLLVNAVDRSFPHGAEYPGASAFLSALARSPSADDKGPSTVVFISADQRAGRTASELAQETLDTDDVLLLESLEDPAGASKSHMFDQFVLYASLYPEYDFAWVSNGAAGNINLARMLHHATSSGLLNIRLHCFIHDIVVTSTGARCISAERRAECSSDGIYVFDSYVDAAGKALQHGLISSDDALLTLSAAEKQISKIRYDNEQQRVARRTEFDRAAQSTVRAVAHRSPGFNGSGLPSVGSSSGRGGGAGGGDAPPRRAPPASYSRRPGDGVHGTPSTTSTAPAKHGVQASLDFDGADDAAPEEHGSSVARGLAGSPDRSKPAVELHVEVSKDTYETLHVNEDEDAQEAAARFCERMGLNAAAGPPLAELVEFKRANRRRSPSMVNDYPDTIQATPVFVSQSHLASTTAVTTERTEAIWTEEAERTSAEASEAAARAEELQRELDETRRARDKAEQDLSMEKEARLSDKESQVAAAKSWDAERESLRRRVDHLASLLAAKDLEVQDAQRGAGEAAAHARDQAEGSRTRLAETVAALKRAEQERDEAIDRAQEAAANAASAREAARAASEARERADGSSADIKEENDALRGLNEQTDRENQHLKKERRTATTRISQATASCSVALGRDVDYESEFAATSTETHSDLLGAVSRHETVVSSLIEHREQTALELEDTRRGLAVVTRERDEARRELDDSKKQAESTARESERNLDEMGYALSQERAGWERRLREAEGKNERGENAAKALRQDLQAAEAERDRAMAARDTAQAEKAAAQADRRELEAKLKAQGDAARRSKDQAAAQANQALERANGALQARERELSAALDERDEAQRKLAAAERQVGALDQERRAQRDVVADLSAAKKDLERNLEDANAAQRAAERAHAAALKDAEDAREQLSEAERARDTARDDARAAMAGRQEADAARDAAVADAAQAIAEAEQAAMARGDSERAADAAQAAAEDAERDAEEARVAAEEAMKRAADAETARDAAQRDSRASQDRAQDADQAASQAQLARDAEAQARARAESERDRALAARDGAEREREAALDDAERARAIASNAQQALRTKDEELRQALWQAEEASGNSRRADQKAAAASAEAKQATDERDAAHTSARQAAAERAAADKAAAEAEQAAKAARDAADRAARDRDQALRDKERAEAKANEAAQAAEMQQTSADDLQHELDAALARIEQLEKTMAEEQERARDDIRRNVAAVRSAFEEQLLNLREERDEISTSQDTLAERLREAHSVREQTEANLDSAARAAAAADAARARAAQNAASAEARLREADSRMASAEREAAALRAAMDTSRSENSALRRDKSALEVRVGALESKCTELEATVTVLRRAATQGHFGASGSATGPEAGSGSSTRPAPTPNSARAPRSSRTPRVSSRSPADKTSSSAPRSGSASTAAVSTPQSAGARYGTSSAAPAQTDSASRPSYSARTRTHYGVVDTRVATSTTVSTASSTTYDRHGMNSSRRYGGSLPSQSGPGKL